MWFETLRNSLFGRNEGRDWTMTYDQRWATLEILSNGLERLVQETKFFNALNGDEKWEIVLSRSDTASVAFVKHKDRVSKFAGCETLLSKQLKELSPQFAQAQAGDPTGRF